MGNPWIKAARLRTLPLALSGIIAGSLMAWHTRFSWLIFGLTIATAILLQVVSNYANDLGDFTKGTDTADRKGEARMLASGAIQPRQMKIALVVLVLLTFLSGCALLLSAKLTTQQYLSMLFLGIASIGAALGYTLGKKAYGYHGLGDLAVLIFFGWVSVLGSYFLQTGNFHWSSILPATAIGLLAVAVLNLNNMRDARGDEKNNKKTLVVQMGMRNAKFYHTVLLATPILLILLYIAPQYHSVYQLMYLITAPILVQLARTVQRNQEPELLDGELKKQALTSFAFAVLFGLGQTF